MKKNTFRQIVRLSLIALLWLGLPATGGAQTLKNGESYWNWKTNPDRRGHQLNFDLSLKINGRRASGVMVFSNLENGEWDDADRLAMPFTGRISGKFVRIEFDLEDTRNFEEYDSPFDIEYRKPKRKRASRVRLKITKGRLELTRIKGKLPLDVPRKILMRRKF